MNADPGKPESERLLAANILADFADDQTDVLASLLMDAAPDQFAVLLPKLQAQASGALAILRAELSKTTDDDAAQEGRCRSPQARGARRPPLVR
jgi:hypothetical protein